MKCSVLEVIKVERKVWDYAKADWQLLQDLLSQHDWNFIKTANPHEGAARMTEAITGYAEQCIGKKVFHERKSTHPWPNATPMA